MDSAITLLELHERAGATPVPRRGRLGLFHFAILLPGRESLGALIAHLAALGTPMGASDHAVSEAIYLQDPDGLGIEVYADRPRASWRYQGRELFMTTEPLDLGDLVRAAGDKRWSGLPDGTVIGHVHLSVGDLDRAEAFFHQGLGFDKVVWSYPGALFLSAGGYHHHLGTNIWAAGSPTPTDSDARLLEWELLVPGTEQSRGAAENLGSKGFAVSPDGSDWVASDPWNTRLRIRAV